MDRQTLLRYLPDAAPSNLAIYISPEANPDAVRHEIEKTAAGQRVLLFSKSDLRGEAIRIFDRTFAITYALEAVAVLVAVMGDRRCALALVIDRRRELGLLHFLGARKPDSKADSGRRDCWDSWPILPVDAGGLHCRRSHICDQQQSSMDDPDFTGRWRSFLRPSHRVCGNRVCRCTLRKWRCS